MSYSRTNWADAVRHLMQGLVLITLLLCMTYFATMRVAQ